MVVDDQAGAYPTAVEALRAVLQEDFPDELEVSRIEIRITGGGLCPYRLYPWTGDDYVGGTATVT